MLCIETDGEITLEEASGRSCSASARTASQDGFPVDTMRPAGRSHASHCGACVDILLPGNGDEDCASLRAEQTASGRVTLPVATTPSAAPLNAAAPTALPRYDAPASQLPPTASLTALRSVVLLI